MQGSTKSSCGVSSRVLIGASMRRQYPKLRKEFPERIEQVVLGPQTGLERTLHNS